MATIEKYTGKDGVTYLPQRHAVHLLVELFEICLYLLVVVGIVFVEAFI